MKPSQGHRMAVPIQRQTWANNLEYLFVTIGMGIGFGNVWRFPYVCYRNGGGAFLIPYLLAVLLFGLPVVFLEGALGQFMSQAALSWRIVPLFEGFAASLTLLSFFSMCYYNTILAWVLYYLFSSMTSVLPWSHCNNDWNTEHCREKVANCSHTNSSMKNMANTTVEFDDSDPLSNNTTSNATTLWMDPSTEFWERKVLGISAGVEYSGSIKWDLALCLLLAWVLVYFCIWKGIRLSGKISYFTVLAPYVFLLILMIRGLTLEGAMEGIKYYIFPDWEKLGQGRVWLEAIIQVFFSYGIGVCNHVALGSCNKFHHNILRAHIIYCVAAALTSFLCGFVIFSVLGFMSTKYNLPMDKVAGSGPGLAFVAYPEAVAQMPWAPVWSIMFFLMLVFVGIDSEFATAESLIISLSDWFPKWTRGSPRKEIFCGLVCVVWFLVGLSTVTEGGVYIQQLFEWYCGGRIMLIIVFLECVIVSYGYGITRFQRNLEYMLGYRIGPIFKVFWMALAPGGCLIMFVSDVILYPEFTYKRKSGVYQFPAWSVAIGWILCLSSVALIPIFMVWKLTNTHGSLLQKFRTLLQPEFNDVQQQRDKGRLGYTFVETEDLEERTDV